MAKNHSERKPPARAVVPLTGIAAAAITAALLFTGGQEVMSTIPTGTSSAAGTQSAMGASVTSPMASDMSHQTPLVAQHTDAPAPAPVTHAPAADPVMAPTQEQVPLVAASVAYALDDTEESGAIQPSSQIDLSGAVAGVDYQSDVVLVSVDGYKSADQIAQDLAASGVDTVDPATVTIVADGVAQVTVRSGSSVEEALGELETTDAVPSAQPNYLYRIDQELMPEDLIERLAYENEVTIEQPQLQVQSDENAGDEALGDQAQIQVQSEDAVSDQIIDEQPQLQVQDEGDVSDQQYGQEDEGTLAIQDETAGGTETTFEPPAQQESPQETLSIQQDTYDQGQATTQYHYVTSPEVAGSTLTQGTQGQDRVYVQTQDPYSQNATVSIQSDQVAVQQDVTMPVQEDQTAQQNMVAEGTNLPPEMQADQPLLETLADATYTPNDTYLDRQWALRSTHALDAWAAGYRTDDAVAVAVLDTGFDIHHEDLAPNIISGSAYNAFHQNSDVTNVASVGNHAMHVAGIVAATANNRIGVAGVSHNARIVPIRVYNDEQGEESGTDTVTLARAFDYVRKNRDKYNIRVINLSMGLSAPLTSDSVLSEMIDQAFNDGIVTVCSAGNAGGTATNIPSDYPTAVGVINLKQRDGGASGVERSDRSNYNAPGKMLKDISAPGTYILSTYYETGNIDSSPVRYEYDSGTSMAAPHVAGTLAVLFARNNFPKNAEGAQRAVDLVCSTAHTIDGSSFSDEYGFGEVDVLAASQNASSYISGPTYLATGTQVSYGGGSNFVSSNPNVLSIGPGGLATALNPGNVVVTATDGTTVIRKAVYVIGDILIDDSATTDTLRTGQSVNLSVDEPAVFRWEWSVDAGDTTAQVTDKVRGVLTTGSKPGTATIRATLQTPQASDYSVELVKTISIGTMRTNIKQAKFSFPTSTYNGSAQTPKPTVTYGNRTLVEGTDFEIGSYANNVNAGTATVTITGIGDFMGTTNVPFVITRANLSSAQVTVADQTYTGSALRPRPTVTLGGRTLTQDTDYTIAGYTDNTNVGTAKVTVEGRGNYTGTKTGTFRIIERERTSIAGATVSLPSATYVYNGTDIRPAAVVTLGGTTLTPGTDYTLSYSNNRNAGQATVTVTGTGAYKDSATGHFTINPASIASATVTVADQRYTGSALEPTPTVRLGSVALTAGTDFTVTGYENNVEVGNDASVTIAGRGNFTGTKTGTFRIVSADAKSIADATVSVSPTTYDYTGKAITPRPTVTLDGVTLTLNEDYRISYRNNVEPGTATYTVTGTGDYTGSKSGTFTIVKSDTKSIADATVTLPSETYVYTGNALEPKPTVKLGGTTLKSGTDYTLTYANNVNVGTATCTVHGIGDYTGTKSVTFKIVEKGSKSIAEADVTVAEATYVYTGSAIKPAVTVKLGDTTLKAGTDYSLSYADNVNAGQARVRVTGEGEYTGSVTRTFTINPARISSAAVSGMASTYTYTGSAITPKPTLSHRGKILSEGRDYQLSYADNTSVGTATITVRATGDNWIGSKTIHFQIVDPSTRHSISGATFSSISDQTYTGSAITPQPTVTLDGVVLTAGTDYTLSYANNVNVGTATVTATGIGDYTSSSSTTFKIVEKSSTTPSTTPSGSSSGTITNGTKPVTTYVPAASYVPVISPYRYAPSYYPRILPTWCNTFAGRASLYNMRLHNLPFLIRMRLGMGLPYSIGNLYYNMYGRMGLASSNPYRYLGNRLPYLRSSGDHYGKWLDGGIYYVEW